MDVESRDPMGITRALFPSPEVQAGAEMSSSSGKEKQ